MTLTYSLTQDDYLNYQLFTASLSDRVRKQRRRRWIISSGALLSLSWLFYQNEDSILTYYFLICALLSIIFYPFYSQWYYKRHYKKYVAETYKNRFGKISNITISHEQIHDIDEAGELKVPISELQKIYETGIYFFLTLKSGSTLIIPKLKVDNVAIVKKELKIITAKQQIDFIELLSWRWK